MKPLAKALVLAALALSLLACGTINTLKKKDDGLKRSSELWSDVPKMDGLSTSELEMPVYMKLLMRTALNQIAGRGAKDTGDWIVFDSTRTPDDVKNFYTNDRMAASGWDKSEKSTCVSGSEYGVAQVGLVCLFVRHNGDKDIGLMIIPAQAEDVRRTNVWFVRVESPRDSTASTTPQSTDKGTPVNKGPAPYGIDQRPMPTGAKVEQLLPAQVGPYKRESLRLGSSQNLTPEEIGGAIDGPIYADYTAGDIGVFVELGVMATVKDARDSLDVAVGDAAGGVFPSDPRFGARGQEPSYLKVIDSDGAFFAWTRGNYYFSAHAKAGE